MMSFDLMSFFPSNLSTNIRCYTITKLNESLIDIIYAVQKKYDLSQAEQYIDINLRKTQYMQKKKKEKNKL